MNSLPPTYPRGESGRTSKVGSERDEYKALARRKVRSVVRPPNVNQVVYQVPWRERRRCELVTTRHARTPDRARSGPPSSPPLASFSPRRAPLGRGGCETFVSVRLSLTLSPLWGAFGPPTRPSGAFAPARGWGLGVAVAVRGGVRSCRRYQTHPSGGPSGRVFPRSSWLVGPHVAVIGLKPQRPTAFPPRSRDGKSRKGPCRMHSANPASVTTA